MMRSISILFLTCTLLCGAAVVAPPEVLRAYGEEDWKAEYDAICAKTSDPGKLTEAEVRSLIDRCDRLRPRIEKLDESTAKVFLKRLKMCRDLFAFMLEATKKN